MKMIIYNGTNEELKAIIAPLEDKLEKAMREVLGWEQFRKVDSLSEQLLPPNAFYEPEEKPKIRIATIEKSNFRVNVRGLVNNHSIQLRSAGGLASFLNSIIADEFVRRVAYKAGLRYDEWLSRTNIDTEIKFSDEVSRHLEILRLGEETFQDFMRSTQPKGAAHHPFSYTAMEASKTYRRLADSEFVNIVANWHQDSLKNFSEASGTVNRPLSSFSEIRFDKKKVDDMPSATDIPDIFFSEENVYRFGIKANTEMLNYDKTSGSFSLKPSSRLIIQPVFLLPKKPDFDFGFSPMDKEAFQLCAYLREYSGFVQYAIQKVPMQLSGKLILSAFAYITE